MTENVEARAEDEAARVALLEAELERVDSDLAGLGERLRQRNPFEPLPRGEREGVAAERLALGERRSALLAELSRAQDARLAALRQAVVADYTGPCAELDAEQAEHVRQAQALLEQCGALADARQAWAERRGHLADALRAAKAKAGMPQVAVPAVPGPDRVYNAWLRLARRTLKDLARARALAANPPRYRKAPQFVRVALPDSPVDTGAGRVRGRRNAR